MRAIPTILLVVVLGLTLPGWAQQPAVEQPAAQPPAPAAEIDLSSPRAAMFTFLEAMEQIALGRETDAAWEAVDATFAAPQAMSPSDRRAAALALLDVLNKLGEVRPLDLPDTESVARRGIHRFVFFPRGEEQQWVWEELKAFNRWPDGSIVLVDTETDGEDRWRFSPATVTGAAALSQSMEPLPPRYVTGVGEDEPAALTVLGPTFERTPWWGWLALLGAIFVGMTIGKLAAAALRSTSRRLNDRGWPLRAITFESFASPLSLALLTLGLALGLRIFIHLDEEIEDLSVKILEFLYLIAAGWVLYNLVDVIEMAIRRVTAKTHNKLDDMVVPLIRKSLRVFIVVVFFLVVAQNVFGLNITGWLAGLGIAGLAVSLAAQDSVKNLFGSLTVFFDKPFVVGDFITYGAYSGTVEEIGFRSTRLRLLSGHLVTIPNMKWIDNDVENIQARPYIRREMNVTITYDTPPEKIDEAVRIVKEVLHDPEVVETGRFDLENQPPRVAFDELNADSLNIKAYYWYQFARDPARGFWTWMEHSEMVNRKLFQRFADAGIEFAFPTQTLYLANDDKRQLAVRLIGNGSTAASDGG